MRFCYIFFLFIPLALFSSPADFKSCQLKYQVSSFTIGTTQAFAVDNEHALFYSEEPPAFEVLKRDPFLGLNLVKSPKPFKHVFKFYSNTPKVLAAVLPGGISEGKILSPQIGLNRLAQFSAPLSENALITGTCCGIVALATPKGVIEKTYIRRFLESKEVVYGDIGIRLCDKEGVRVAEVNPFFEDSPFLLDDIILEMNGKKVLNASRVSREILFSKPGSVHSFVIERAKKKMKLETLMQKCLSGGLVPDSFFNLFGLELDEKLEVKSDNPKYEIKKGDRLLQVMGKNVSTLEGIRQHLSREKMSTNKVIVLLFRRSGFDFFIRFPKP
ncbi:MAG: PDZ domain-containing protein [Campylobacterales bacterium]|nr:PDZ domain-containing protein [Campylobacterales bacterium]